MKSWKYLVIALLGVAATSCMTQKQHEANLSTAKEREFTLGLVQKHITKGMSSVEVLESLGSPNIVQKDKEGNETWVYDKIATEASYSRSSASGGAGLVLLWPMDLGLGLSGGASKSSGASGSSQKTLTVIIKFDQDNKVSSFSYHSSKF